MDGFLFNAPPTLIDFSPKAAGKGNIITIAGSNLNDITSIKLGGSFVASFRRITSSTVLAVVGSGSSGSLELVTSGGRATLSGFTFIPAPIINSFTPTSAAAGTLMTVTGAHLTGTSEVSLGGVPVASFQVLSSTTLIIVVGSGASGSLYLATPGGSGSLGGFKFLLYPPNTIPVFSNAFSPNGDGINDYWRLDFLRDYPNATIQVMNRLGHVVFSSIGYNQPWDGRYKGEILPVGTYYYIINLKNGMPPIIGSITIIR
jgi:gliding motility-associated-like protein